MNDKPMSRGERPILAVLENVVKTETEERIANIENVRENETGREIKNEIVIESGREIETETDSEREIGKEKGKGTKIENANATIGIEEKDEAVQREEGV